MPSPFLDPHSVPSSSATDENGRTSGADAREEVAKLTRQNTNELLGNVVKSSGRFDSDEDEDEDEDVEEMTVRERRKSVTSVTDDGEEGAVNVSMGNMRSRKFSSMRRKQSMSRMNVEEDEDEENNNNNSGHKTSGSGDSDDGNKNRGTGKKSLKDTYLEMTAHEFSCRHRFYNIIHGDPVVSPDDYIGSTYHSILIIAILISILTLILSSDPAFYTPNDDDPVFAIFEYVSVAIFSIDIILQLASAEVKEHVLHFQFLIDLTSVLGFYIGLIITAATGETANTGAFLILRIFRLTRVLRVLKVSSAANAMQLVITTLMNSKQGLLMLISLISVVTLLGGSILYFLELQEAEFDENSVEWFRDNGEVSPFQSVPETFWFVVATITTIGYGDVVPYTILGRIATMILMLFGVLLLSFPNILIGAQFQLIHSSFQRDKSRKALGTVFRRARMIIRFVRMWREFSVRGTINELLDYDPLQQVPDEDEDEGDLDLYGDEDEEEEEEEEDEFTSMQRLREKEEKEKAKKRESSLEYLLHVPEHMMKRHRHYVNFWFYPGEFPAINFDVSDKVLQQGNFDRFTVGGSESGGSRFTGLQFTQRLLESFSGCATADEIFESFALYPPYEGANIRLADVILMMLHLGKSRHLLVFCLSRTDENFVCALSKSGLSIVRTYPEDGLVTCPCFRSLNSAALIWKRTTKKSLPLDSPYGFDGYPRWQVAQALVPRVDVTAFTENLRLHSSRRNHVVFLKSGFKPQFHNAMMITGKEGTGVVNAGGVSGNFLGTAEQTVIGGNNNNSSQRNRSRGGNDYSSTPPSAIGTQQQHGSFSAGNPHGSGSLAAMPSISITGEKQKHDELAFTATIRPDQIFGNDVNQYCAHCVHCQSQAAVLPQRDVDPLWKSKQDQARSEFIWSTDEETLDLQIAYLQNWKNIIRHCKKHPQKVKRPS